MHLQRHVSAVRGGWTCMFSRSDLCSEAISLPCILIYASYSHVAGEPGLLAVWAWNGPGHSLGLGAELPISHRWHHHVMVCQISLLLSFKEAELLHLPAADITQVQEGCVCVCVGVCVSLCLLLRYFNNRGRSFLGFFFLFKMLGLFPDVPWRLSHVELATNVAKHWALCPDLHTCTHLPTLLTPPPKIPSARAHS